MAAIFFSRCHWQFFSSDGGGDRIALLCERHRHDALWLYQGIMTSLESIQILSVLLEHKQVLSLVEGSKTLSIFGSKFAGRPELETLPTFRRAPQLPLIEQMNQLRRLVCSP